MFYRTSMGEEFDISDFSDEEKRQFNWLIDEYQSAKSWVSFQQYTANKIIEAAKVKYGENWINSPLYKIQLDLVGNVGIRQSELGGELSDMIVDKF